MITKYQNLCIAINVGIKIRKGHFLCCFTLVKELKKINESFLFQINCLG